MNNKRLFLYSTFIVINTVIIAACSHQNDVVPAPTPVHVMTAKPGPGAAEIVTTGTVAAADESKLSFKVGGIIQRIAVREGEPVKAGQLLAELIPTDVDAQLQQAQQLNDKAQRDLQRGERLYADQVIPLAQLQDLRTQAKVAAAQLQAAEFNQEHARIVAPAAGTILRKLAEEHELVAPAQPVLVLGASNKGFVVRSALSDRDAVQLHVGDAATVQLDAFGGKKFSGYLSEIGGAAQIENGLFPVEVHLKNVNETLASGLIAQVSIQPDQASTQSLLYVPTGAVVSGVGRRADLFVLSHENGQDVARRREVTVAFFSRDQVALSSGIQAGDQVITDGALYLSDGEHVSVQAQ
ncbi:MAG TPA: efflux RND transporter periplasmic adaptor subunit [Steroidobacteraceae bacterium]|nr:efflux RND transporter periplasmic adaptor subunit [Steroidobacteraceae bacterium]